MRHSEAPLPNAKVLDATRAGILFQNSSFQDFLRAELCKLQARICDEHDAVVANLECCTTELTCRRSHRTDVQKALSLQTSMTQTSMPVARAAKPTSSDWCEVESFGSQSCDHMSARLGIRDSDFLSFDREQDSSEHQAFGDLFPNETAQTPLATTPRTSIVKFVDEGAGGKTVPKHVGDDTEMSASVRCLSPPGFVDDPEAEPGNMFKVLPVWQSEGAGKGPCASSCLRASRTYRDFAKTARTRSLDEDAVTFRGLRGRLLIDPTSKLHFAWEITCQALLLYEIIVLPLEVFDLPNKTFLLAIEWITRLAWTINIGVGFSTGYLDHKGCQVMYPPAVAKRYLITWLPLDAMCVLVDWAEVVAGLCLRNTDEDNNFTTILRTMTILRFLRVFRLVRLTKNSTMIGLIHERIRNERVIVLGAILKIMIYMVVFTHLIGCGWYGIGCYGTSRRNSWVKQEELQNEAFVVKYIWSFHCALGMFTGEHIVHPRNMLERSFMVVVLILTLLISAWIVSSITNAMTRLSILAGRTSSQFAALRHYLSDNCITTELAGKIQRNAQYAVMDQKRNAPESSIDLLKLISDPLRSELHFEVHSHVVLVHPLFRRIAECNETAIHKICHQAVTAHNFTGSDIVFAEGEAPVAPKIYMIAGGKLLYSQEHLDSQRVSEKHWLAEAVLWTEWSYRGTLFALNECRLLSIDAQKFHNILSKFPGINVRTYAIEFCKHLSTSSPEDLSDVGSENSVTKYFIDVAFPGLIERSSSLRPSTRSSISIFSDNPVRSIASLKEQVGCVLRRVLGSLTSQSS